MPVLRSWSASLLGSSGRWDGLLDFNSNCVWWGRGCLCWSSQLGHLFFLNFFISLIVSLFVLNINMKLNFHAYCCLVLNLMLFFCAGEFVSGFDGVTSFHFVGLVVEGHLFAN